MSSLHDYLASSGAVVAPLTSGVLASGLANGWDRESQHRQDAGGNLPRKLNGAKLEVSAAERMSASGLPYSYDHEVLPGNKTGSRHYKAELRVYRDGKTYKLDAKANAIEGVARAGWPVAIYYNPDEDSDFLIGLWDEQNQCAHLLGVWGRQTILSKYGKQSKLANRKGDRRVVYVPLKELMALKHAPFGVFCGWAKP